MGVADPVGQHDKLGEALDPLRHHLIAGERLWDSQSPDLVEFNDAGLICLSAHVHLPVAVEAAESIESVADRLNEGHLLALLFVVLQKVGRMPDAT